MGPSLETEELEAWAQSRGLSNADKEQLLAVFQERDAGRWREWYDACASCGASRKMGECDACAIEGMKGPGTPYARWHLILDMLEERFPDRESFRSDEIAETRYIRDIDLLIDRNKKMIQVLDTLRAAQTLVGAVALLQSQTARENSLGIMARIDAAVDLLKDIT